MTSRLVTAVAASVVVAAACSSDDQASAPPVRTMPRGLEICAEITGEDDPVIDECLDAIEFELAARTSASAGSGPPTWEHFDRAIALIAPYSRNLAVGASFTRDPTPGERTDANTEPVMTSWQIGVRTRTLWTCFEGTAVSVSTDEC